MTDEQLRVLWYENGGEFHGPNVETGSMPEARLLAFLRHTIEKEREACARICDGHHDRARSSAGAARANACAIDIRNRGKQ